jgi:hypothetical protein
MSTFDPQDGLVLLRPEVDAEAFLDAVLADSGQRRVAAYDKGHTSISRLFGSSTREWLLPDTDLHLPKDIGGLAAEVCYAEDDEWGPPERVAVYRVVSTAEGDFRVTETLPAHGANGETDPLGLLIEALLAAAGIPGESPRFVFHEPQGRFSCRVVERTFAYLKGLASTEWRVERDANGVQAVTPIGPYPPWRRLTEDEWEEIRAALGA